MAKKKKAKNKKVKWAVFKGSLIRFARERAGMTQRELTEKTGTSRQQLIDIETGKKDNPTVKTLFLIALALECPITDFFN